MNIKSIAQYVDQPLVLNKIEKRMPVLLVGAGCVYGIYDTYKSVKNKSNNKKKKIVLKNSIITAAAIAASWIGARGIKTGEINFKLGKNFFNIPQKQIIPALLPISSKKDIIKKQTDSITAYISQTKPENEKVLLLLNKAKNKPLSPAEIDCLTKILPEDKNKKVLFNTILPEPKNLKARDIFSEIGRLSLLGAIPVTGGVLGGIAADKVISECSKKSIANKIKEGFYQYFANIFLCNVGACAALFIAEGLQKSGKIKPLSPAKKMLVIISGIASTGIIGGSYIANKMSQKIIDPIFNKGKNISHKSIYDERHPELTDIALHADDIATAGVLSGFKWIEPALPLMYFISGYRAGIGYRN